MLRSGKSDTAESNVSQLGDTGSSGRIRELAEDQRSNVETWTKPAVVPLGGAAFSAAGITGEYTDQTDPSVLKSTGS